MRGLMRSGFLVAVITSSLVLTCVVLGTNVRHAMACSCALSYPTVADRIGMSDVAFVGQLESAEELDAPEGDGPFGSYDMRYELVVEHAVKGVLTGDRVVMFGSTSETSCGTSTLDASRSRHAIVTYADLSGRLIADSTPPCASSPSVDELLAVDMTLPPTRAGPVSVIVVGRVGAATLVAYDAEGAPVAYGSFHAGGQPAICPGSRRVVQLEQAQPTGLPALAVRDVAKLEAVDEITLDTSVVSPSSAWQVVNAMRLDCRDADGADVVGVLSWENALDGQTTVLRVRSPDHGGVSTRSLGTAQRARYDAATDSVIAFVDGALVRFGIDSGDAQVVAQLTAPARPLDTVTIFIEPDAHSGWWIGLGDGENGLTDRLRTLAHVDATGAVEHWPVEPVIEWVYGARVDGDSIVVSDRERVTLPAPGTSAQGVIVTSAGPVESVSELRLDDGRSVRPTWTESDSTVELASADGTTVTLQHLLDDVRFAVAVDDGPTADPAVVDRQLTAPLVESQWITRPATSAPTAPLPTTRQTPTSTAAPDPVPAPVADERVDGSSTERWMQVSGGLAGAALIGVVAARRRRSTAGPRHGT